MTKITTAADVINLLNTYRDELKASETWMSTWPVLDRFLVREAEMRPVWENIARQTLNGEQCHELLFQLSCAGAFGTPEHALQLKDDVQQLGQLNDDIQQYADTLAQMLAAREAILDRNSFGVERMTHIVELMDAAGESNGNYTGWLRDRLDALCGQFDGKYWPTLQEILAEVGRERPQIGFMSASDEAIVNGRGKTVPDYLRELFNCIENVRESHWGLPAGFKLTDSNLATLAMVSLDLPDVVTTEQIKTRRTHFYKAGLRGAWASPSAR
ncbi:hypothetical protein EO763_23120 (plasmid) [Pectobacterium odoriferum]|uniref:hypothetical protein n=1 Tax=Pectobacterium odoriferum TaxID=78398 RepID=UPI00137466DB|nr:hypothetical protein [Pectobacterium odoriferum]QHP82788.1 hypothetical protein EO763_23120 [Pectobacterium odoriferum]